MPIPKEKPKKMGIRNKITDSIEQAKPKGKQKNNEGVKAKIGRPSPMPGVKRKKTTISLTEETIKRLKLAVIEEDSKRDGPCDMSLLVEEALLEYFKKYKY
jgi:hypothetical protein